MRFAFILAGACLLLGGCLSAPEIVKPQEYILDPELQVDVAATVALTLGIREIEAAQPYRLPMVFVDGENRLGYRRLEQWAEKPADMVTRILSDAIAASQKFSDAGDANEMPRPDLILTGKLRKFHEKRDETPAQAVVELRLEIRWARDTESVWADTLSASSPLADTSVNAFVDAVSQALSDVIGQAATKISSLSL